MFGLFLARCPHLGTSKMNERINEFIKQSYVTVQSPSGEGYTHFSQVKFAQLIVEECLMKANGAKIRGESIDTLIQNITEDFGVK